MSARVSPSHSRPHPLSVPSYRRRLLRPSYKAALIAEGLEFPERRQRIQKIPWIRATFPPALRLIDFFSSSTLTLLVLTGFAPLDPTKNLPHLRFLDFFFFVVRPSDYLSRILMIGYSIFQLYTT